MPWAFLRGDARGSERAHLLDLLATLPAGALVLADAGFVGYGLFASILASERHVLVRVGANVRLPSGVYAERRRRRGDLPWLWPDAAQEANRPRP